MHLHTCTLAHSSVHNRHTIYMHTQYAPLYTHICTHMDNTCIYSHPCMHTHYIDICVYAHVHAQIHVHTKIHISAHTQVHTHVQSICMYTDMCTVHNIFTHVCAHTHSSGQAGPPQGTVSTQSKHCRMQHSFSDHCSLHKDKLPAKFGLSFMICMQLPSERCWKDSWT